MIRGFEQKKAGRGVIVAACSESYKPINAASTFSAVVYWHRGILFEAFPTCFQATKHVCWFFFIVSSMMAPARIGVCLICRAKLVHKKKDFGRGHVYRIIADTDCWICASCSCGNNGRDCIMGLVLVSIFLAVEKCKRITARIVQFWVPA